MADEQLELPGVVPPLTGQTTAMVTAAHRSLAELERVGTVTTRHAVQVQLVLSLSAAIDAGTRSGRASAVAMAARELRETMLVLDPPPEDPAEGAEARRLLDAFMGRVEDHANQLRGEATP